MAFDAFPANSGTSTPAASSTPAPDTSTPSTPATPATPSAPEAPTHPEHPGPRGAAAAGSVTPPASTGESVTPEWSLNPKFKVMDKEYEFDDFLRGAITDEAAEKKVRELYEKAYGLDHVKPRMKEYQEKAKTYETQLTNVMGEIQQAKQLYAAKDFDNFFKALNIDEKTVLQYFLDKANYSQLPPEQREVLDARKSAENRARTAEQRAMTIEQQLEAQSAQVKATQLQIALGKPDVNQFASNFDSAGVKNSQGNTISFRDAVIEAGEYAWYASKGQVDLTPEQAVAEVMARYGAIANRTSPAGTPPVIPAQTQNAPAASPATPAVKKTLPNLNGRNATAVSSAKPRSIADLKKLAAQMSQ